MKALLRIEDEECFKAVNPEIIIEFDDAYEREDEEGSGEKAEEPNDEEKIDGADVDFGISKNDAHFEIDSNQKNKDALTRTVEKKLLSREGNQDED